MYIFGTKNNRAMLFKFQRKIPFPNLIHCGLLSLQACGCLSCPAQPTVCGRFADFSGKKRTVTPASTWFDGTDNFKPVATIFTIDHKWKWRWEPQVMPRVKQKHFSPALLGVKRFASSLSRVQVIRGWACGRLWYFDSALEGGSGHVWSSLLVSVVLF